MNTRSLLVLLGVLGVGVGVGVVVSPPGVATEPMLDLLQVVFFDVGQGDSAVLITPEPDRKVIIIDGGFVNTARASIVPFLEGQNITTIDLMILTHPDMDHVSGLREIIRELDVSEIWDPGFDGDTQTYQNFETEAQAEAGVRYYAPLEDQIVTDVSLDTDDVAERRIVIGQPETFDGLQIIPLHTDDFLDGPTHAYDVNNSSIVVKVVFGENSILFTGDANGRGNNASPEETETNGPFFTEAALLQVETASPGILQSTVLKAPHHGSLTSSSTQFLEKVRPQWVVISSGVTSSNLPRPATLTRYGNLKANILRTDVLDQSDTKGDDHLLLIMGRDEGSLIWRQTSSLLPDSEE